MANNESIGFLLSETARIWRNKLDQRLRPQGLSQAKWLVLVHLNMAKSELTQKELTNSSFCPARHQRASSLPLAVQNIKEQGRMNSQEEWVMGSIGNGILLS